jgi:hypothetical protein
MSIDTSAGHLALLFLIASTVGCSGANMLEQKKPAPALSARVDGSIEAIDGRSLNLSELSRKGPVMLVFLRGFS